MHLRTRFVVSLALLLGAAPALGQTRDPEPGAYSFVSGTGHGAALWVNPGAAGFNRAVDLMGHMTWDRPEGGDWSTGQYTAGFHSRVIAFGYRHDEFQAGSQGDAYTAALGVARGRNGFGVSRTWRSVGDAQGSWEIGYVNHGVSGVSLGLVWSDIGSPTVRDTVRHERLIGAVTYRPPTTSVSVSAQGNYRLDGGRFNGFRIGGSVVILGSLDTFALAEWDGEGDFMALRLGATLGGARARLFGGAGLDSGGNARTASAGLTYRSEQR
ncbi:MAG: hypothetical protein GTO46_15685 [Gemmatimonadetes bacterium]|nr:hypothetical protein [Gemmatimonadota bacterium]NIO33078.1 hypothetical protein [Gemmatimonadota bacterium]